MRVEDVGELTDLGYWRLVYDDCGHVQEFAQEGLDDLEHAALYIRRHFAECLICASNKRWRAEETVNVVPSEIHMVLSPEEMRRLIDVLRQADEQQLAHRFARILRQTGHTSAAPPQVDP